MQNLSHTSSLHKSDRANSMEDSPRMTIEYLRARLLAERSVSKAAKERADELEKRVTELEEQLKVVALQRKTAEKATLDVLAYLASRGISDISETCASDSDQDESLCESNMGEHETSKKEDNYESCGLKENNESSSSDHDSTPSSSRSLSWKGHKETAQQFDMKSFDSSIKRRTSVAQIVPSPRHRSGKSCRQIKRRELRSVVEDSRNDSTKSDGQDDNTVNPSDKFPNHLDSGGKELESSHEKRVQNHIRKNDILLSSLLYSGGCASGSHKHTSSGEMDIALENQAKLIGCYKAQEKAQKDWEEKHKENNIGTPDSSEPGDHSDVTEEKDENKSPVLHSSKISSGKRHSNIIGMETQFQDKPSFTHFNNVKVSQQHSDTGCSQNDNFGDKNASSSSTPDFAFSDVDRRLIQDHGASFLIQSASEKSPDLVRPTASEDTNRNSALVPQQESQRLGNVLGVLQEAKSLIKQQMNSLPATSGSVGKSLETPPIRDGGDWFKVPVGCPGLFRVPTDLQSHASHSGFLTSDCSPDFRHSGAFTIQGDQYNARLLNPPFSHPNPNPSTSEPVISERQLRFDFHFDTNHSSSTKSSFSRAPDIFPSLPLNQISFSPVPSEAQKPSPGSPFYYGHDFRSNTYR